MKVGEITRSYWYVFKDGVFSFHTAFHNENQVTFRSPHDVWPSTTAAQNFIPYTFMRNSTEEEIMAWNIANPDKLLIEKQEAKMIES